MKTTIEIAERLIKLLREKKIVQAYEELFDEYAESVDPLDKNVESLKGLQKLIDKEKKFLSKIEISKINISDPICAGDYFSIHLKMFFKLSEREVTIEELCVYQVCAGKIIRQQFFI